MQNQLVIRDAVSLDSVAIQCLLKQMGYPTDLKKLEQKLAQFQHDPAEVILVAELDGQVCGVISMHYIPQLAIDGDFARLNFFCVDEHIRHHQVGKKLLNAVELLAQQRGCDRMELHCAMHREAAHVFYQAQHYIDSPKYFMKKIAEHNNQINAIT